MQMDVTFNTNRLKLPLTNMIGVDNYMKIFTVVLSFIREELIVDFDFIFICLDELVFYQDDNLRAVVIYCPKVLITNQSTGLRSTDLNHPTWNIVFHQLYVWQLVRNMKVLVLGHHVH